MNTFRKATAGAAIVAASLAGGAIGASLLGTANAQTATTTPAASSSTAAPSGQPSGQPPQADPSKGGHQANGITESPLTGDTATKVTAAAKAAVPGATVERVETDAEGATYEAHMVKSDGTHVTVKVNADFSVKTVENGM